MERCAVAKGRRAQCLCAARNIQPLKRTAFKESAVADCFDGFRQHHSLQRRTAVKCTGADILNLIAELNHFERSASRKQFVRNLGKRCRQTNRFQLRKIHECAGADILNRIRNDDAFEIFASAKRVIIDMRCSVDKLNFLQRIEHGKRIGRNHPERRRNDKPLDALAHDTAHGMRGQSDIILRDFQNTVCHLHHRGARQCQETADFIHYLLNSLGFRSKQQLFTKIQGSFRNMTEQLKSLPFRKIFRKRNRGKTIATKKAPLSELSER